MVGVKSLSALALNCTLKASSADEPSSTDKLLGDMLAAMEPYGVQGEIVRAADHDIKPGVRSDEGPGDDWPDLRKRILAADIFILGMPIWLGRAGRRAHRDRECERDAGAGGSRGGASPRRPNEDAISAAFSRYADRLRYDHHRGRWYLWEKTRWRAQFLRLGKADRRGGDQINRIACRGNNICARQKEGRSRKTGTQAA